ncbi:MAG: hypothetical protein IT488_09755 [Gammaproteobacteria bacterium]|nr:hypothetical protein [Gammaproteobacteria bacterium]
MNLLQTGVALGGTGSLLALAVYIYLAARGDSVTLYSTVNHRLLNWKQNVFLVFAAIGFLVCMFAGAESMLHWMPNSWGGVNEDGEYEAYRTVIATSFSVIGGFAFAGFIDKATRNAIFLDMMRDRARFLEKIVVATSGNGSLADIRDNLNSRLRNVNAQSGHRSNERPLGILCPDEERAIQYRELLEMIDLIETQREKK